MEKTEHKTTFLPLIITDHLNYKHKPTNKLEFMYYLLGLSQGRGRLKYKNLKKMINLKWKIIHFRLHCNPFSFVNDLWHPCRSRNPLTKTNIQGALWELDKFYRSAVGLLDLSAGDHFKDANLIYHLKSELKEGSLKKNLKTSGFHLVIIDLFRSSKFIYDLIKLPTVLSKRINPLFVIKESIRLLFLNWFKKIGTNESIYENYWFVGLIESLIKKKEMKLHLKTSLVRSPTFILERNPPKITFELIVSYVDKNFLVIVKNLLGGELLGNQPSILILNLPFPEIRLIFNLLDRRPLISSKYLKHFKFRKIYRICQRKEHLTKKGLLQILNLGFSF